LKVDSCLMSVCWMVSIVMLVDSLLAFRYSPVPATTRGVLHSCQITDTARPVYTQQNKTTDLVHTLQVN
jgi:hypothetical protein